MLLAALTAWLYVSYGAWALAWTWPVHLVLVLTEPLADIPLRWVCRVAVFAAFYLLLCWPWWKARAGIWSGFLWVAAQLAALTVAYQVLSAK